MYWTIKKRPLTNYALSLVTAPATEPVTLASVKSHCRVPAALTDDDSDLADYIASAREYVEDFLGRRLVTQTWDLIFDSFPYVREGIYLPYGPLQSITSVKYIDSGGAQQTLSPSIYTVDATSFAPSIYPQWAQVWPIIRPIPQAVTIRMVVGYTTIPPKIVQAIKLLVGHSFENREAATDAVLRNIPMGALNLLTMEKASWI